VIAEFGIACVPFWAMKICAIFLIVVSTSVLAQSRPATAGDETQQLLQALADAPGPSGFEDPVRKIMVEHMKPLSDKLSYDGLGLSHLRARDEWSAHYGGRAHGRTGRRGAQGDE
jgi:hypothetical protein